MSETFVDVTWVHPRTRKALAKRYGSIVDIAGPARWVLCVPGQLTGGTLVRDLEREVDTAIEKQVRDGYMCLDQGLHVALAAHDMSLANVVKEAMNGDRTAMQDWKNHGQASACRYALAAKEK